MNWAQARVLVTGGGGFLGSHLIEAVRGRGCTRIDAPSARECDLRDRRNVQRLFACASFDVVFHLAASVGGIGANQRNPASYFYDNAIMGLHLIDNASRSGAGLLVLLGTICAYPKFAPLPFREEDLWSGYPEETNAPYGVAKRSLVVCAEGYRQQHGLKYTALFPTNLYGPRDNFDPESSHVIPALIRKCEEARARKEGEIVLWGTGDPSRDFLYVEDAVEGIVRAAERPEAEAQTMNLGSEKEVAIRGLADTVVRATGFSGTVRWDASRPDGQPRRCVSSEKARRLIGFAPRVTLEEGIARTIQWYRSAR